MNKISILVIEDSKTFNSMVANLLRGFGYDVLQCYTLKESIKLLESCHIDYIMLDLNLPDGSGELLVQAIQYQTKAKIIVMTGSEDITYRDRLFSLGIVDYFIKTTPIHIIINCANSLIETLEEHKNTTILTIDDSNFMRKVLKNILESKGYNVLEASNATEAKDILQHNEIYLILLDLIMPTINGMMFLEDIKSRQEYRNIPVIVISGDTSRSNYARVLKQGASDFIKKPFIVEEVLLKCDIHIKSFLNFLEITNHKKSILAQNNIIKLQKQQIEKTAIYLRGLIEASLDPLVAISVKGKILDVNSAFCTIINEEYKKLIGSSFSGYFTNSKDAEELYRKTLSHEKVVNFPLEFKHNNEAIEVVFSSSIYKDEKGDISGILATARDIAEIKRLRDKDEQISKLKSMSELIRNISHQWRQPLSVISTASSGLLVKKEYGLLTDEFFQTACEKIISQSEYLSKTIDDFQLLFKQDSEKIKINMRVFIENILEDYHLYCHNNSIELILNIDEIELLTYENSLKQSIVNLLNNIKEHAKESRFIFINVYQKDLELIINIKDSGGGIEKDILSQLFEPYFTTEHTYLGKGLGLYVVDQIIKEHLKGSVEVFNTSYTYTNIKYKGLEFIIKIPVENTV